MEDLVRRLFISNGKSEKSGSVTAAAEVPTTNFGVMQVTAFWTNDQFDLGTRYDLGVYASPRSFGIVPFGGVAPGFIGKGIDGDMSEMQKPDDTSFEFTATQEELPNHTWTIAVADRWALELKATANESGGDVTLQGWVHYESPEGPFFKFGNTSVSNDAPFTFSPTVQGGFELPITASDTGEGVVFTVNLIYSIESGKLSGDANVVYKFP